MKAVFLFSHNYFSFLFPVGFDSSSEQLKMKYRGGRRGGGGEEGKVSGRDGLNRMIADSVAPKSIGLLEEERRSQETAPRIS